MAYISINIIAPNGRTYKAEIDENVSSEFLLSELAKTLGLETKTSDGHPVKYTLSLLKDLKIHEGATIKIDREDLHAGPRQPIKMPISGIVRSDGLSPALANAIQIFKGEHDSPKTVFLMMKFPAGDPKKDRKLKNLVNAIKLELDKYGLEVVRADEKTYAPTHYIWDNAQVYLNGCNYGIAVLENIYCDEMNPNVALEYGYMLAQGKQVLLLKEKLFQNIRADILGKIWKEFEIDKRESTQKAIENWMVDLGIVKIKGAS